MSSNRIYARISLGLAILTCSIVIGLDFAGILPRRSSDITEARIQLCESLANESLAAMDRNDYAAVKRLFDGVVRRNEDALSIGLRSAVGRLLVTTSRHTQLWDPEEEEGSSLSHARIPILRHGKDDATIEVRFASSSTLGFVEGVVSSALFQVLVSIAFAGFLTYLVYLRRVLRHLDPASVIPSRVQAALDVMAEGVLLVDRNGRIVLANSTFVDLLGRPIESLIGVKASDLGWLVPKSLEPARDLPWDRVLDDAESHIGTPLSVKVGLDSIGTFVVNGAPVAEESGKPRGAIVTFDNVTELEQKTVQLEQALVTIEKSRDEIRMRNDELQVMATCDPLTGLANRRSFMQRAELEFETAVRASSKLCCLMIDIDHFKSVNDDHGHVMGDEILSRLAQELARACRDRELVCRYGGEEFCILLTEAEMEEAADLAERLRRTIAAEGFASFPVTVSFGVSSVSFGAMRFIDLLNQADQALYASKENGRNRVTRFDEIKAAT